ncbi:hypothetical protein Rleg4DRAFT_1139 [Rhizobium leguminosarum bv. trifolii WSM2297]|uniref:Transposase n=1 Tax=Rhizobium leguminosarum bv. trifolii WSM2297 TaxID=754762 RepID=J0KPW5_RHILT|nr:hypothetical protein Rleg4DRAFT_1139 [Rhizobium leguminosarum bv. trifolii WSM2297]
MRTYYRVATETRARFNGSKAALLNLLLFRVLAIRPGSTHDGGAVG